MNKLSDIAMELIKQKWFQRDDGKYEVQVRAGTPSGSFIVDCGIMPKIAERIVADHNALAGMNPEALGALIEACNLAVKSEATSDSLCNLLESLAWVKKALAKLETTP